MSPRTVLVLLAAALGLLIWTAGAASAERTTFRCRTSATRPVAGNQTFNLGNRRIAVALPKRATFVAVPEGQPGWAWVQANGWISTKIGWWTKRGTPHVVGRRIDGLALPLRVDMGRRTYANVAFYPSILHFPSAGCWRITATASSATLVAIVKVVKR